MEDANPTKSRFHGVFSLVLAMAAFGLGLVVVFSNSLLMGAVYALILLAGTLAIVRSFCSKCPCRLDGCSHVLPGKLSRLFPPRQPGPYSKGDIAGVAVPLLLMTAFPQYWLRHSQWLLLGFWLPLIEAAVEIRLYVCPRCSNENCPARARPR